MERLKAWKKAATIDGGIFLSIVLAMAVIFSVKTYVCWDDPPYGLTSTQREHAEDCLMAQRELGDRALQTRPECHDVLDRLTAAGKTAP